LVKYVASRKGKPGKLIGDRIRRIADHWLITLPSMGQETLDLVDPPSAGLEFTTEEFWGKNIKITIENYDFTCKVMMIPWEFDMGFLPMETGSS